MGNGRRRSVVKEVTEERIAELLAQGSKIPKTQIAKAMGMSRKMVYYYENKSSVQNMVKSIQEKFLQENLPVATQNIHDIVHKKVSKLGDRRLQFDASRDVLKSVGMLPTTEQSIVVQQMFQQNNIVLNPIVQGILDKHLGSLMNFKSDVAEGEVVEKEIAR